MMKIAALNEAPRAPPENDDEDVQTITKEAQEQIALTEYNRALELMKRSNIDEALAIFKDLLDTELLDQVEKLEVPDGRSRPMLSLKYSCFKNIGAIQTSLENYEEAIDNYCEAANLDDTDVTLWYRIGCLAMTISNLELACSSFKQGLKCNPNHWPCLDNIISTLYAVPDYMNCLLFASMALERDPSYVKALAFRERIFRDIPYMEENYKLYNVDWALDPPLDTEYDKVLGEKLLAEAKEISRKWADACKFEFIHKPLPVLSLNKPLSKSTWLELGESLINMHKWMSDNSRNFVSRVCLDFQKAPGEESNVSSVEEETNNDEEIEDADMENFERSSAGEKNDIDMTNLEIDGKQDNDIEEMDITENSEDQRVPTADYETELRSELEEDAKSGSSDIQIIEDEDPFKIPRAELFRVEKNNEEREKNLEESLNFPEAMIVGEDEDTDVSAVEKMANDANSCDKSNDEPTEKSNPEGSDKGSEKLNDKSNDKSFKGEEKSNERTEGKEEGQKVKKRRRSSLCFLQQWAWSSSSMRRSARVRGSNRKEAERDDVQLEETLRRMFPSTLLPDGVKLTKDDPFKNIDDSMDTMDLYQLFANRENTCNLTEGSKSTESSKPSSPDTVEQPKYFDTETEKADVDEFINEHSGKSNLMIIIAKFTEFMSTKWNYEWPKEMGQVYLQAYSFTREHIPHPSPFGEEDADHGILKYDAEMTLLFGELHTDRWMDNKPDVLPTSNLDQLGTGMPSEELGHIIFASVRDDLFNEENTTYLLRVLWLKANIFHCQGDTDIVIETLELLLNHMEEFRQHQTPLPSVKLPNCKYNSHINIPVIQKMLTAIRRGQKLGEVQRLYDEKKYAELAATLQDTFKFARQRQKLVPHIKVTTDRIDQLSMLLDSLWKLEQYEECYVWAEACLNESWQNYLNSNEDNEQKKWSASVLKCLEKMDSCVSEVSTFVVRYLPETRLARLVQNLVQIVCHQLDVTELAIEMPLETVLPWIILHYILQYEEDKGRAKSPSQKTKEQNSESEDEDEDIPTSIMILLTAHEFLGRHSWCCINEAKLLIFTMKLVIPRLRTPQFASVRDKLGKYLEQIFYCLYGHPNKEKKTKPKYLEDHRVPQIELTWEGAQLLFDFYRPDVLPEYDTPRAASINADTHNLFRKIIELVPEEHNPSSKIEDVKSYIVGDIDKMPNVKKPLPYQVSSIYALQGDYLFKYNQYANSTNFFLMDICLHPEAFNSWATLAMVTSTEFGTALTSCKPLPDTKKLLFDAKIAQCCYQRAVDLVPAQSVIWIEYGTFAYTVHSFCSRLLKQETDTLSMERFAALETRKEDTLEIAVNCFISANRMFLANIDDHSNVHDERWLYHYMLAKIAEKKNNDPPIYLDHYAKASDWLHKNNAHYPRRLQHKNPNYLSVEALEVHYRIHACILKYLEQHEGKPLKKSLGQVFLSHLIDCANGPFMQYTSKLNRSKHTDNNGYPDAMYNDMIVTGIPKSRTNNERRLNSVEEIPMPEKTEIVVKSTKSETRKRQADGLQHEDSGKRMKLGNVSHLQLMQDVVGLIDDLITNVCEIVAQRDSSGDEIMILSSDESEKAHKVVSKEDSRKKERARNIVDERVNTCADQKLPRCQSPDDKAENVQDLMDALMKRAMEMSNEAQPSPPDEDDTRKSEGKWLQNDDVQSLESGRYGAAKTDKESKDKCADKKKTQVNSVKDEVTLSRRGSQESNATTHTTTTTTEGNNSSSSSSDESSSSEDSSETDSSSDSDSESAESENDKKKSPVEAEDEKEEYLTDVEVGKLIAYCLAGLEQCVLRFPEHYKSIYRLCHYYFNNRAAKDNTKCRDLLLGTYKCQYYSGLTFQGLFADRKTTNFFNGVWRNPIEEIDRPGSFASHMSRCVTLLMQILKETDDSWMLMELCVQLRKIPDADKKYLRDSEREQLSRQAQTLCLQSLRARIQNMPAPPANAENIHVFRNDPRKQVLLDVYKIYREVQKTFQGKDSTIQAFATLLTDTYKAYTGVKNVEGNILEVALKCCHQTLLASKIAASNSVPTTSIVTTPTTSSSPVTTSQPQSLPTSPQTQHTRKPYKSSTSTGRPRGRPPNVNKYLQAMQQSGTLGGQFNTKGTSGFSNYLGVNNTNRSLMNPYFMNPLMDPSMLSAAVLAAGLGGNMLESFTAVNYLNQMGYPEIMRQYQNNLSSISNLAAAGYGNIPTSMTNSGTSNVPTSSATSSGVGGVATTGNLGNMAPMGNLGSLTVQQLLNLSNSTATTSRASPMYHQATPKTTTTTSSTKEAPSISITPVGTGLQQQQQQQQQQPQQQQQQQQAQHKTKVSKHSSSHNEPLPAHISKSMPIPQGTAKPVSHPPTTQVSLLKPSVIQQTKPPKQMSAPQIRVSKSLTEPQPAHNSSVSHSSLNTVNASANSGSMPQAAHTSLQGSSSLSIKPTISMGLPPTRSSGTSLQHKLLSKKMAQQAAPLQPTKLPNNPSTKKQKVPKANMPQLPNNLQSLLNTMSAGSAMGQTPFIPPELSGISVSPVAQTVQKPPPPPKHPPFRKAPSKTKTVPLEMPVPMQANPMPATNTAETLSMLSQLQQHSHLEIIPQQKCHAKPNQIDYSKNVPLSLSVVPPQKLAENIRTSSSECMSVYELSRSKSNNNSSKKQDSSKHSKESVEIITLDD